MAENKSLEEYTPEQLAEMAGTYQMMLQNPETRELALRITKKIKPELSIPEIELKDAARAEFKTLNEKNEALEQKIREGDVRERIRDERQKLKDSGFSADEVAAIEKIMMDDHIPSYETAAKHYKGQQQIATPAPYNGGAATTYNMPNEPMTALKGGRAGLNKWARQEATNALDEIRSGRIRLQ